jgi:hypothetical protein
MRNQLQLTRECDLRVARRAHSAFTVAAILCFANLAGADAAAPDSQPAVEPRDAKGEAPIVAYTCSAAGAPARTLGAQGYGVGLAGPGQRPSAGGGIMMYGSPIDRLTFIVDAPRNVYMLERFTPSAAMIVRILGTPGNGFSLGALGKYKVEGFGTDKNGDTESEIETGLLLSYAKYAFHADLNAITGFGLTDDGEIDTEMRLRMGYDVTSLVRVGADGQFRYRLAGTSRLFNGSLWDFAAGPQLMVGTNHVFGALTGGPTTMGLTRGGVAGWSIVASVGGAL